MRSRGADFADEAEFSVKTGLIDYEHGRFDGHEFLCRVNELLDVPMSSNALRDAWNGIFTPLPEMLSFVAKLKHHCGIYLLSNTSDLHWAHLKKTYGLEEICHGLLASYEVGAMKPSAAIYRAFELRFGLTAKTTLFIDDKQENIAGAMACGWQGLWRRDQQQIMVRLRRLVGSDD